MKIESCTRSTKNSEGTTIKQVAKKDENSKRGGRQCRQKKNKGGIESKSAH